MGRRLKCGHEAPWRGRARHLVLSQQLRLCQCSPRDARSTCFWAVTRPKKEGCCSGGPGRGARGWVAPSRGEQREQPGNWTVACSCQGKGHGLFPGTTRALTHPQFPLPPSPNPNHAGRRNWVRRQKDRQTRRCWVPESGMIGADIHGGSSRPQEQAGGTVQGLCGGHCGGPRWQVLSSPPRGAVRSPCRAGACCPL